MENKGPTKYKDFYVVPSKRSYLNKKTTLKRKWQGSEKCCFCHKNKTIKHLFLNAVLHE
jgi:hypothetical protein